MRLSSAFLFRDTQPGTISILYGWSRICGQRGLCFCVFFPVTSSKLIIKFNFLSYQLFFAYYCRTYSHRYKMTTPSNVCILLSLFAPSAILLNFSLNTLRSSLLNLCWISILFSFSPSTFCNPRNLFFASTHTFSSFLSSCQQDFHR